MALIFCALGVALGENFIGKFIAIIFIVVLILLIGFLMFSKKIVNFYAGICWTIKRHLDDMYLPDYFV